MTDAGHSVMMTILGVFQQVGRWVRSTVRHEKQMICSYLLFQELDLVDLRGETDEAGCALLKDRNTKPQ